MSDAFISYTRLDEKFVNRLREALLASDLEIWIDWESIPPSRAFWEEIKKGIARASNFVIVLSPNSMSSPICQMELEYAREMHKRIIPVMHIDYEKQDAIMSLAGRLADPRESATREIWGDRQPHSTFDANDDDLKKINFFFFRPEDNFDEGLAELLIVIRTDFEHKEQHSNYQNRALEWRNQNKDSGYLLIDSELEVAKGWISGAKDKVPQPTPLQREHIEASSIRARRFRAIRYSAITSVLVLVAVAIVSGLVISETRREVDASRSRVESLDLAALAQRLHGEDRRALAVAVAANRVMNPAPVAESVLAEIAYSWRARQMFAVGERPVTSVTFSRDGNFAAAGTWGGAVSVWDIQSGERMFEDEMHDPRVRVLDLAFSPDGDLLVSSSRDAVVLRDLTTLERITLFDVGAVEVSFSEDGTAVSAILITGIVATHRFSDNHKSYSVPADTDARGTNSDVAAFSQSFPLAASGADSTLTLWDTSSGEVRHRIATDIDPIQAVTISPDGSTVAVAGRDPVRWAVRFWDTRTGDSKGSLVAGYTVESLAYSPDGGTLLVGLINDWIQVWDVRTGTLRQTLTGHQAQTLALAYSHDGRYGLSGSFDGSMIMWDFASGGRIDIPEIQIETICDDIEVQAGKLSFDSRFPIQLKDATGKVLRTYQGDSAPINCIAVSPDEKKLVAASGSDQLMVWDLESGERLRTLENYTAVTSVAYSSDGDFIVSGSSNGTVKVWDAQSWELLRAFDGQRNRIRTVGFILEGSAVYSQAQDGTEIAWRFDSRDELLDWTQDNLYFPELECIDRTSLGIQTDCK